MPNAKELHSLVDYNRSLSFTNLPAISELFNVPVITDEGDPADYPFGHHNFFWNASKHPAGNYFYRMRAGKYFESKAMTLLK